MFDEIALRKRGPIGLLQKLYGKNFMACALVSICDQNSNNNSIKIS